MTKNPYLLVLAMILVGTNCWNFRILQGWKDPNCAEWSADGSTCLKCIPRAYNNTQQNICVRVDDNCKTWSTTNGQCIKCYDSYGDAWKNGNAINGKCPYYNGPQDGMDNQTVFQATPEIVQGYDVNCKCFDDQHKCLECYKAYQFDAQGYCIPLAAANCQNFVNGICIECQQGFYLNQQSDCVELPANCTKVDDMGNCSECAISFILLESGECVPEIMNCTTYTSKGMCQQCDNGFYVTSQGQCEMLPQNCLTADTNGECLTCEQGYILSQGTCEKMIPNCMTTDENGICSKCMEGYYLNTQKMCKELPANCTTANPSGQCTQCQDGFVITNGQCSVPIGQNPNCAQQDEKGKCTSCRNFYELINGDCVPTGQNPFCKPGACECGTGKCLECQKGYFLDNNGICTQIAQNCQEYSKNNGSCTSCKQNFDLVKGQCVPSKGGKGKINLDCKTQTSDGKCTQCRKYYKLSEGDCIPSGPNPKCRLYNKKKQCECCFYHERYYLDSNGICQEKNMDCAQFNPQNGWCTLCLDGSEPIKGKCPPASESS